MEENLGFDFLFKKMPQLSPLQFMWSTMAATCWFTSGFYQVGSIFTQYTPPHRCQNELDRRFRNESGHHSISYEAGLFSTEGLKNPSCQMYNISWSRLCPMEEEQEALECAKNFFKDADLTELEVISCDKNVFDITTEPAFTNTVTTEFNLVCDRAHFSSILTSCFMAGMVLGVVLGGLIMDRFGRKLACLTGQLGSVVINLAIAFSNSISIYAALRFFAAFFSMVQATSCFVYCVEIIGPKYRTWMGNWAAVLFTFGFMCISPIVTIFKDWREMQIAFSFAPIPFIAIYFWILPNSAAWLYSVGKFEEAKSAVKNIAYQLNVKGINEDFLEKLEAEVKNCQKKAIVGKKYTQLDLIKSAGMRRTTITICIFWFCLVTLYYGLTFGMSDLGGNVIYTNLGFGVAEAFGFGTVSFLIDHPYFGRRKGNMYIAAFATAGCFSAFIGDLLQLSMLKIVSAFVGKLGASAAFGVAYIYASELFPTPMRGIGVGTASACGRIGGVLSPFIADFSRFASYLPFALFTVFGLALISATYFLPETLSMPMLISKDQAEDFYRVSYGRKDNRKEEELLKI
ncbi:unnamed protein product [Oikopleura dioica]|uniref:Major facilitator superfamily (MFS) profile domain-containing protein n=1 Tax=Oikopleura dioica TaxID=34765 RepID=E4X8G1_OIKDI|nr:unnamed protein product [Oikopleura dioica]